MVPWSDEWEGADHRLTKGIVYKPEYKETNRFSTAYVSSITVHTASKINE